MKISNPHAAGLCCLAVLVSLSLSCAGVKKSRAVLGIGIHHNLTHIAVGSRLMISAFQEYTDTTSDDGETVHAEGVRNTRRAAINARWSVSDQSIATIADDGTLTALKPGRIEVKGAWESFGASTQIEVLKSLPGDYLPQIRRRNEGASCSPVGLEISLAEGRMLSFHMSMAPNRSSDESGDEPCSDVAFNELAPETPLPWTFQAQNASVRLTAAHGAIVTGNVAGGAGDIEFSAWAGGDGSFPLSLSGKTVLLVGDSMAEGVGPWLKKKVEGVGGKFIDGHERSSTIVWWQGSGHFAALIAEHRPDIVFIALGSNEIFLDKPEQRIPLIQQMVAELGSRPGYWIGPPSWKPDHGLVRVINENFQAGRFFDSNNLTLPRADDGKHPTVQGYQEWTGLIWNWYSKTI